MKKINFPQIVSRSVIDIFFSNSNAAPTQSPSYVSETQSSSPGAAALPLSMDPVLAIVTNATGHQVLLEIQLKKYKYFFTKCKIPFEMVKILFFPCKMSA